MFYIIPQEANKSQCFSSNRKMEEHKFWNVTRKKMYGQS